MTKHINPKFKIRKSELESAINLSLSRNGDSEFVVPPTELRNVESISLMGKRDIEQLVRNIPLRGTDLFPYKNSCIDVYKISPEAIKIGQSFVLEEKILDLCRLPSHFSDFSLTGIANVPPALLYGRNEDDEYCCSIYIPPLLEIHDNRQVLIDGMHRSYLAKSAGSTMMYVVVRGADAELPFDPQGWSAVSQMSERPEIKDRYVNLDISKFRDLSVVGIDG
ncbi:MAG: hypothetical protein CMH61_02465 [Nanoarchaeota archaeon]|nr:hypothetical protein [Nanoarchaeota archaeon]|tara:strand:+ start:1549 stop:2214 length:666 start_codon:yes stop_codon:yes gene_type:complete